MAVIVLTRAELVCRLHDEPVSVEAAAFVRERSAGSGRWEPACDSCLDGLPPYTTHEVVYLNPNDDSLKPSPDPADNNG